MEVDVVQILRDAFRSCDREQLFRKVDPSDSPCDPTLIAAGIAEAPLQPADAHLRRRQK